MTTTNPSECYLGKLPEYYAQVNQPLLQLINRSGLRVLDVGCGAGANGCWLLENGKASWVTGIELVPQHGEAARSLLNEVRIGPIEDMELDWLPGRFDCFVFGDVLEHLVEPWRLLRRLRPFLAEDGFVVASIPNIQHIAVLLDLGMRGEWRYHHDGILDVTHLRFFTRRSAIRLFEETGYRVESARPFFSGRRYALASRLTAGLLNDWLAQRWLLRAVLR